MPRPTKRPPLEGAALFLRAIEELGGPCLLLDEELRIVAATSAVEGLLGVPAPPGVTAPQLLCGQSVERPIAEALAHGRPVMASVVRPRRAGGEQVLRVRALPLRGGAGWVVLLAEEQAAPEGVDAPVNFHGLWTRDPAMKRLFRIIERVARRSASVLVRGDTGSGKELVARAIHDLSPRVQGPFHALNCAALPPNLLESELFGHVRGAFTGAVRDTPGHFRLARGGTLFLDEVAELPLELQAKLLRVLETRTVIPVGGREPVPVDVRIVAATHRALRQEVAAGRFRADLMYRLRVVPLFLPPLRARRGDVLLLAHRFIDEFNQQEGRRIERIAAGAQALLERHDWPGNVRELRNVVEYAFAVGEGPVLVEADLPAEILQRGEAAGALAEAGPGAAPVNVPPEAAASDSAEMARIRRALERAGGHHGRAARMLGISRVTLWRRLKESS